MSKKVLIVEDDKEVLFIMKYILEDTGYEVIISDSDNVIQNVLDVQPNLILLDDWIPGERGSEICKRIKSNSQMKHIPVFIVSAVSGRDLTARECLADGFIEKPFELHYFEKKIKYVLSNR